MFALDLADIGVDVWDRRLLATRRGVWLRSLLLGLMSRPPLGYREIPLGQDRVAQVPVWPNRVQEQLLGPRFDKQLRA